MFSLKARWAIASGVVVIFLTGAAIYTSLEKKVTIKADDRVVEITTFKKTVKELLADQGINIEPEDVVMPSPETELRNGMNIVVKRAFPVKITVDGKEKLLKTQPDSVINLLLKAGIGLGERDKVKPALCDYIAENGDITITRVDQRITKNIEAIPYETVSRKDSNLPFGERKVAQKGEEGQEEITLVEVLEDGKVVSATTESIILKAPKPQIVLTGTLQLASRAGVDFTYSEKRQMMATAYTHTGNRTATGTTARVGVIAVDPKVIPLGTRVYIDGYGFARAEDTGGAIKGDKIDLFMNTREETRRFGRRWVTVYILK